jgi:outer membrane immunogenic protein
MQGLGMKRLTMSVIAMGALFATVNGAASADLEASMYDWSGMYGGLQAGYALGHDNNDVSGSFNENFQDFVGGLHVGWQSQSNSLVYGIEFDGEFSNLDANNSAGGDTASLDLDAIASARARFGVAADRLLVYATGGLALGIADYDISNGVADEGFGDTPVGFTVGAGLQYAFTDRMSARVEYRYTDLGKEKFPSALFPGDTFTADYKFHAIRAGLSWQF